MGKIFISCGSGGGTSSDELTVTSENVLEGESYVGSDTDDEIGTGTMKDYSGVEQTATASLDSTNSQLEMTIPNTGKYSALSKLSATFATIANLIGIDTSKMLNTLTLLGKTGTIGSQAAKTWYATTGDQTVIAAGTYASGTQKLSKLSHTNLSAGNVATGVTVKVNNGHADVYSVTGTYKGKGTATAAQVLTGYTFSSASLSGASGTMTNNGAVSKSITPGTSAQSYTIPAGYHNGSGKVSVAAIPSSYKNVQTKTGSSTVSSTTYKPGDGYTYRLAKFSPGVTPLVVCVFDGEHAVYWRSGRNVMSFRETSNNGWAEDGTNVKFTSSECIVPIYASSGKQFWWEVIGY